MTEEYAIFAARFSVPVDAAYTLPAVFERCAQIAAMPLRSFVTMATYSNNPLGEYIKTVAIKLAKEDT